MRKNHFSHVLGAVATIILVLDTAVADPITVTPTSTGSSVDVVINESNCASWAPCTVTTAISSDLDSITALLGIGDNMTFDFFDIIVGGLGSVTDATVTATLAFISPEIGAVASGEGSFFTFFGLFSGGSLIWDQPGLVNLGDGSYLQILFEDVKTIGFGNTTTVSASVGRTGAYVAVPEPGTLALFGIGLIVIAWSRRRLRNN